MSISRRICTGSSKTMFLRIVHPGGHTELHDRPVLAAEIMCRNPRYCVAYPHVFQQPWAIVAPDTMLMLGQKFYVVPLSTIRKLQRLSPKHSPSSRHSPSPVQEIRNVQFNNEEDDGMISTCCIFRNKIPKQPHNYNKLERNKRERSEIRTEGRNVNLDTMDKHDCFSGNNCFTCLFNRVTIKENPNDFPKETRASSSNTGSCDTNTLTRRRAQDLTEAGITSSTRRIWSSEHWQPSLESITEE